MTIDLWIALAAANFVASAAPGQCVALVGSAAVRGGLHGASLAIGGILLAEGLWSTIAIGLALGAREVSPTLFLGLQTASGLALVTFGVTTLMSLRRQSDSVLSPHSDRRMTLEGLWIGLANPLALIFFLSLFPAFVPEDLFAVTPGVALFYISAVLLSTTAALVPYAITADVLKRLGWGPVLNVVSSVTLIALGAILLYRVWM